MNSIFSNRPEHIAGNMKTSKFVSFWSTGKDRFLSNPPNSDLSILEGDEFCQIVVELQEPALKSDDTLTTLSRCCRARYLRRRPTYRCLLYLSFRLKGEIFFQTLRFFTFVQNDNKIRK